MKTRIVSLLMILVLACAAPFSLSAQDKLTIAIPPSFVPFMFKKDGEWTGFEIELWRAVAEANDWEYQFTTMNFSGILTALQTARVDGAIAAITITSKREEVMDFSHPYYDSGLMLMVRANNDSVEGPDDIEGKTLAVTQGTTAAEYAPKLDPADIKRFPRAEQAYLEVRTGRADAALHDTPNVQYYIRTAGGGQVKAVGPNLEAQSYGMAFPQGSDLREAFNITLLAMMEDGRYDKLYKEWFGQTSD